ncbi:hypothetical protein SK128_020669 [Halocaridina rubra]|uniref:Uncharacterized protein n=1 Tax=Halocaridina rubra TaxID=373956 RepID=A0AAN8XDC6_HALRR
MIVIISALLALASVVSCRPDYHPGANHYSPPNYNFGYAVSDPYKGTNFGHSESRNGYDTKGHYFVNLPDGRVQEVSYVADASGYHPVVTYKGGAHHPSYGHAPIAHGAPVHGVVGGYH